MKHWATANGVKMIAYATTVNSYNIISAKNICLQSMTVKEISDLPSKINTEILSGL